MNHNKVNVVDLEMLCWDVEEEEGIPEISEVGIVQIDMVSREITRQQHFYCKVKQIGMVSDFYTELTGTPRKRLYKAQHTISEVIDILVRKWGFGTNLWISWGRDNTILKPEWEYDPPHLNLAALMNVMTQPHRRLSLDAGLSLLGLEFEGRKHNAVCDAFNTARGFLKFVEGYKLKTIEGYKMLVTSDGSEQSAH